MRLMQDAEYQELEGLRKDSDGTHVGLCIDATKTT